MKLDPAVREFISILQKTEHVSKHASLIVVHPAKQLNFLKTICFDKEYGWNQDYIITARFKVKASLPEEVFGTIFLEIVKQASEPNPENPVFEEGSGFSWISLKKEALLIRKKYDENGKLSIHEFVTALNNLDGRSKAGRRLVIFVELNGGINDPLRWKYYLESLVKKLPFRVFLVISGLPDTVEINMRIPYHHELNIDDILDQINPKKRVVRQISFENNSAVSDEASKIDLLNRSQYANALAQIVLHKDTKPLTIGIHGPWGKGKSAFMKCIMKELESEEENNPPITCLPVEFDAWLYSDASQVWAGMLNKISKEIEKELKWKKTFLHNLFHYGSKNIANLLGAAAVAFLIFIAAAYSIDVINLLPPEFQNNELTEFLLSLLNNSGINELLPDNPNAKEFVLKLITGGTSSFLFIWYRLIKIIRPMSERISQYTKLPYYSKETGFQNTVKDELNDLQGILKDDTRVIVFIDNLDRCSEESIMEVLQAIILILSETKCYVFLGIDTKVIYKAIRKHYTTDGNLPDKNFPREYLKKILQISFYLPSMESEERQNLIKHYFSSVTVNEFERKQQEFSINETKTSLEEVELIVNSSLLLPVTKRETEVVTEITVSDTVHELDAFDRYKDCLNDNPRDIKRAINIHRLMKIMLQRHGFQGSWTAQRQRQLVRLVIFCSCWPELIKIILKQEFTALEIDDDVLYHAAKNYKEYVRDKKRRERLKNITSSNSDDIISKEDIVNVFLFTVQSCKLIEDIE